MTDQLTPEQLAKLQAEFETTRQERDQLRDQVKQQQVDFMRQLGRNEGLQQAIDRMVAGALKAGAK